MVVTWDQDLVTNPALDTGNWRGTLFDGFTHQTYTCATAAAAGNLTTHLLIVGSPTSGPPDVSYLAPPFDVLNQTQTPAPAFADFPVTML